MSAAAKLCRITAMALALTAIAPATAAALYANAAAGVEGAELVSADYARHEQGDDTTRFAAISADGRYVAIESFARNFFADDDPDPPSGYRAGGIFRFDLQSKRLEKVADGNVMAENGAFLRRGASNPSISADGRFIAFATAQQLLPADSNENIDVYVRDMSVPLQSGGACQPGPPCAYELVSARDGSDAPASYGPPQFPFPGSNPGSDVSRGVAISADGSRVAFRTEAPSDLPARPGADTPAGQIFVRDLSTGTTTLVTAVRDAGGTMTAQPAGGAIGAALSADGTTVAWTGANAAAQTRFLNGENADPSFPYYLWRRIAAGPTAPTRRITGLADPDDATCAKQEEENLAMTTNFDQTGIGPCYGPLTDQEANRTGISSLLPALSGDGYTVAFLTGAGPRPNANTGTGLDLFLTDMRPGLSRKGATTELTRDPANFDPGTSSPVTGVSISPSGRYLALTTVRNQFQLPALRLLGKPRAVPSTQELFVVDLATRTIERASHSNEGGDINGDVQNGATISDDGSRLAFTSFAGDLFRGDANQRADAFVAYRIPDPGGEDGGGGGGGASSAQVQRGAPRLLVRAHSKAAGIVVLTVTVPAAGSIEAVARTRAGSPPHPLIVATRKTHARGRGSLKLVMKAQPRFRPSLEKGAELKAKVRVSFKPSAGGKRLHASTTAVFSD